jgi:hypothetical protein
LQISSTSSSHVKRLTGKETGSSYLAHDRLL